MTTSLRLVDDSFSVTLRPTEPASDDAIWVHSYNLGFPEMREVVQAATGQSGTLDLTEFHGARTVTITCTVTGDSVMTQHEWADILKIMCHPARRPYLYVLQDGWAGERRMALRCTGLSYVIDRDAVGGLKMSLSWVAPTGLMESGLAAQTRVRAPVGAIGKTYPMSRGVTGWSYSPANSSATTVIPNNGTGTTPPVYRIYGECTSPVIRNGLTGEVMAFPGMSIPAGHYVEIDVANRTVFLDSTPALNYYRYIDWSQSTWWEFKPGDTLLSMSTSSQDSNCELLVQHRERWL